MSLLTEKTALRRTFKTLRAAIENRIEAQERMTKRLLQHPDFLQADQVFCFVSFGSEPDTHAFLNACFAKGTPVAVPRCFADGSMLFYRIESLDVLQPSPPYGIPEPRADSEEAKASAHTFCVVPGLAFDDQGYRLGYGGGFYDRFLSDFPGRTAGLCFDACLTQRLPHAEHDRPVQSMITEQTMIQI